jgi:hypothetical protein
VDVAVNEGSRNGIWLPPSQRAREATYVCWVPVTTEGDRTCGERFFTEAALKRHVRQCISDHQLQIHRSSTATRLPELYGRENEAAEVEDWLAETDAGGKSNRQKVVEGSKRLGEKRFQRPEG